MKTIRPWSLGHYLLLVAIACTHNVHLADAQPPEEVEAAAKAAPATLNVSDKEAKLAEELFQDGRKLFFQGQYLESIKKLKAAAETNPAKTSYLLLQAKAYRAIKQDGAAIKLFEEILKGNPDHIEAGVELAQLLTPQKEPERIIAMLEPLLKLKHSYALYHLLAESHYQKEQFKDARKYFEEAVKLNPRNRADHYQLGNIYLAQKRFAKAAVTYQMAGQLGHSTGVYHFKLASVYFNLRNFLGKISIVQVNGGEVGEISNELYLIDLVPGTKNKFHVAGSRSAIFQIAKAKKAGIDIVDLRFLEANTWLSAHHYAKADSIYKTLQKDVPKEDVGFYWSQWAITALELNDFENYIGRLQAAIDAQPKVYEATMSDALVTVARRYQQQGNQAKYVEFLGKAIAQNPLSARLHLTLGDAHWAEDDKPKAIQQYKLVLELEPEFSQRVRLLNRIRGEVDNAPIQTTSTAGSPSTTVTITNIKCLVSGKPAIDEFTMSYKGGEVHFCSAAYKEEFTKNLTKYSAKANHYLVLSGQAQSTQCVFTGRPNNPKLTLVVQGAVIPFCCKGCQTKAKKASGDEQLELIFNNAAFAKHFAVR
ncbi:MAG: tetratricopeptide (TPR) repeat protein [Pirellulaceae bacterium]|jgi:tetratricopeptide (TPR) repeat protein